MQHKISPLQKSLKKKPLPQKKKKSTALRCRIIISQITLVVPSHLALAASYTTTGTTTTTFASCSHPIPCVCKLRYSSRRIEDATRFDGDAPKKKTHLQSCDLSRFLEENLPAVFFSWGVRDTYFCRASS